MKFQKNTNMIAIILEYIYQINKTLEQNQIMNTFKPNPIIPIKTKYANSFFLEYFVLLKIHNLHKT